ncbi:Uma2 family endonuclease [Bacillus niameyensis]|uniref:Uma2 family endonuclease n=1 Tax=Bacillus niameyensis TaxID=1522308 RepID=UPI000781AE1A|nr:Uma2 family endonuclease [Bacillus niameyensis]
MSQLHIDHRKSYVVKDIADWEGRWELIEGIPHLLSSPSRLHQTISRRLLTGLENYLQEKDCEVFNAPFDVFLSENSDEDYDQHRNAVQPDLFIVCDPLKIHDRGVKGAPDWIAEIISPSTAKLDRLKKFNLYEKFLIPEYWLISPYEQTIEVFILNDQGRYVRREVYGVEDTISLQQFKDFPLTVSDLFKGFSIKQE